MIELIMGMVPAIVIFCSALWTTREVRAINEWGDRCLARNLAESAGRYGRAEYDLVGRWDGQYQTGRITVEESGLGWQVHLVARTRSATAYVDCDDQALYEAIRQMLGER